MRRTSRILIVAAALALLAACGGQKAAQDPPPTHSRTVSASSSPTAPVMPALAKEHTKAGAAAFVRYYWEVVNFAQSTLDTGALRALADASCQGCQGGAQVLDAISTSGGVLKGGAYKVTKVVTTPNDPNLYYAKVTVTHGEQRVLGGASPTSYPSGTTTFVMVLVANGAGWHVDRLDGAS